MRADDACAAAVAPTLPTVCVCVRARASCTRIMLRTCYPQIFPDSTTFIKSTISDKMITLLSVWEQLSPPVCVFSSVDEGSKVAVCLWLVDWFQAGGGFAPGR